MSTRAVQYAPFQIGFRDPSTDVALDGGSAEFYVADGNFSTSKNAYEDVNRSSTITSVTLNGFGQYPTGLYFDGGQTYDIRVKNSSGDVKYNLTNIKMPQTTENNRTVTSASVTATIDDDLLLMDSDTAAQAQTANLYPAADSIKKISIKNTGATYSVTVDPDGSELIDGVSTLTIPPGAAKDIYSDGASWFTVTTSSGLTSLTSTDSTEIIDGGSDGTDAAIKTVIKAEGNVTFGNGTTNTPNVIFDDSVNDTQASMDVISERFRIFTSYRGAAAVEQIKIDCSTNDITTEGNVNGLKSKIVDIGDWNMDTTTTANVAHGLTLSKIRTIDVMIRNDIDTIYYPLNHNPSTGISGYYLADATNVIMSRVAGGFFDNASYDATSYNRGWITIWYVA